MHHDGVGFERDIRPLFRDKDVQSMSSAFDLSSYEDVRASADKILVTVANGSMPCDGPWPAERVELFRGSVDAGCPDYMIVRDSTRVAVPPDLAARATVLGFAALGIGVAAELLFAGNGHDRGSLRPQSATETEG